MSEETDLLKTIRQHFLRTVAALSEKVEIDTRLDIRDKIAALALIDRVLAREKSDDTDRGSAVRKYAGAFQTTHGTGRRATTTGQSPDDEPDDEPGRDSGLDGSERDEPERYEDDASIPTVG